ncbi:MAG: choice-of-anchor tandem repeat GloVer-containing protein [Candidatus Sulfotelmatobacter sp.]
MRDQTPPKIFLALFAGAACLAAVHATAQTETVLYSFNNSTKVQGGKSPEAPVIFDAAGNLYGTTYYGGNGGSTGCARNGGCGTVFELVPQAGGGWTEKVLHNFGHAQDGYNPAAGLVFDKAGNLYGTTVYGGKKYCGIVFELSPESGGHWNYTVIYDFCSQSEDADGDLPYGSLIFDSAGNLYGATAEGGLYGTGTVFELSPNAGGSWSEKVLYSFGSSFENGWFPSAPLTLDSAGNLYGAAASGGNYDSEVCPFGCGVVFELAKTNGEWSENVLYSFSTSGTDCVQPNGGLIFDPAGNLYGTSFYGAGMFELTPQTGGTWTETVTDISGGAYPEAGLVRGASGNLYGTTLSGGNHSSTGIVFELSPAAGGGFTQRTLFEFNGKDGADPYASLTLDALGNLYGTTYKGGAEGGGTVFEITP